MSPRVHPKASSFSLSKFDNFSSWSRFKAEVMIIGKDSSCPRKAYLRESGKGFKSSGTVEVSQAEATSAIQSTKKYNLLLLLKETKEKN